MFGIRLGRWGAQLLSGVIVGMGLLAPAWHQKAILVTLGLVAIAFYRWAAPDHAERVEIEQQRQRDERRLKL